MARDPNVSGGGMVVLDHLTDPNSDARAALGAAFGTDPLLTPVRAALEAGTDSFALGITGDSTADDDGSGSMSALFASGGLRWFERAARKIAAAYPAFHVISRKWNPTTEDFDPWVTVQAHPAGRRYVNIVGRSLRWRPWDGSVPAFASGNLDLRMLVQVDNWASGAERTLLTRHKGAGTFGTEFGWRWRLMGDGTLRLNWSTNGTSYTSDRNSSVPVTAPGGVPLWLRVTLENTLATGWVVKFYTSPDSGTWTQLGTTLSFSGTVAALFPSTAHIEVGGEGWQPAATPLGGRVYEVQVRDGVAGPTIAPAAVERWERYPDPSTTYGGAPTLYLINGSRSGAAMSYLADPVRRPKLAPDYGQLVHYFSTGHNEIEYTGPDWIPPYKAWVDATLARLPQAAPVLIGQNPHTAAWPQEASLGQQHITRIGQLRAQARQWRWPFLDVFKAFTDDPRGVAALLTADGLHPECPTGMEVWATAAVRQLGITT
jgi:hypothetical protein